MNLQFNSYGKIINLSEWMAGGAIQQKTYVDALILKYCNKLDEQVKIRKERKAIRLKLTLAIIEDILRIKIVPKEAY